MRKRIPAFAILMICLSFWTTPAFALKDDAAVLEELKTDSKAVFLYDIDHERIILQKNATQKYPVASLTKIMTALVTLEKRQLDEKVTITHEMVSNLGDYVSIGLQPGQRVTVEDLLYATLLPSAGDAAQALAISTGGSLEGFAKMMNQKAAELKLNNTHFSNPVGMNENNYSTAKDMSVVLREALKNETFTKIFQTYEHHLKSANLAAIKTFKKRAAFLGGKTGYTELAGRCLASNANINGVNYAMITLGANPNSNNHLKDADKIYGYVSENYIKHDILKVGDTIATLAVTDSDQKTLDLKADQSATAILHKDITREQLEYRYEGIDTITPEIELGSELGTLSIYYGKEKLYETKVYLRDAIEFYDYPLIIASFIAGGIFIAGLVLAVILFVYSRIKS